MANLGDIITTVQHNCHISDARYAGNYTMCIFLLKMREFYRWENQIELTKPMPRREIGDWLVDREQTWNRIEEDDYLPISLNGDFVDPFDSAAINAALLPSGIVYSSGYGLHQKPHFFLGELVSTEQRHNLTIYVSSCEYARDLVAPPAMMRESTVFVRQESLRRYLWERIEGWQFNKSNRETPMGRALACYGYRPERVEPVLDRMTRDETESLILHEVGEVLAGEQLGDQWEQMLMRFPSTRLEFMARASRDLLADCTTTLPDLMAAGNEASLHFYFANLTGMRKYLYPQLSRAYEQWIANPQGTDLLEAVKRGRDYWQQRCQSALELFYQHGDQACDPITEYLDPATH
jgi:hypothetical protein